MTDLPLPEEQEADENHNPPNCGKPEEVFTGLVAEQQHARQCSNPAAAQTQAQECALRNAPGFPLGLEFVVTKK
ncbi:MAG: hypothetical protein WBJ23_09120 [Anaerolineaceae bacterium]